MRTVSIFKNGNNRAIRLPRDLDFEGVSELEIVREGDSIILRPVRPTWGSFLELEKADPDFMTEREDVGSPLPRTLRIAEVNFNAGADSKF